MRVCVELTVGIGAGRARLEALARGEEVRRGTAGRTMASADVSAD